MREHRLAPLGGHELAELDSVGLGLVGNEDVDGLGVRVVELDLDGVGGLAAVRVGQRHVGGDAGRADGAACCPLAQLGVDRDQQLADVRSLVALAASVYLVIVLEILKFRRFREREIQRQVETGEMEALSAEEIEREVEREVETGEFEAVRGD